MLFRRFIGKLQSKRPLEKVFFAKVTWTWRAGKVAARFWLFELDVRNQAEKKFQNQLQPET